MFRPRNTFWPPRMNGPNMLHTARPPQLGGNALRLLYSLRADSQTSEKFHLPFVTIS